MFVSYGSRELDGSRGGGRGGFGGDPKANTEALKAAGINSYFYVSPDTAHEWLSWRRSLHAFAQLLFQDQPAEFQSSHQMTGTSPATSAAAPAGQPSGTDGIPYFLQVEDDLREKSERIKGKVRVAEHLGSDTFLHVTTDRVGTLTVRATGGVDVSYGDQVHVTPDPSKIHRFDQSGATIT